MPIGVIVPVHGDAPWLAQALDSVLAEAPDEVVVVDDGSPQPVRLAERQAAVCRLVRLEERRGPAGARDAGLAALSADLIALCDADDRWTRGKLELQEAGLVRFPDSALCFGGVTVVDAGGQPTGERWPEPPHHGQLHPEELAGLLWEQNPVLTSSVLIRRDALEQVGGFAGGPPVPLASDWELWLRLVGAGWPFVWVPRAEVHYRRHDAGVSMDLAALAESRLVIHDAHAGLVSREEALHGKCGDHVLRARGLVRRRDYAGARRALAEAAELAPLGRRERALAALLRVPLARRALGRRDPYGRRARR